MGPHATACYGATTIRQHNTSQANGSAEHDWNVQNWPGQTLVHDEMDVSPMTARGGDSVSGVAA